jgi:hypothetical protein
MDTFPPPSATDVLGPIWIVLLGSGFAFFGLSRNGLLKRRLWPLYMVAVWLFIVPVVVWFGLPVGLAIFGIVGWAAIAYLNYRAWRFCASCGRGSLVVFSPGVAELCSKCGATRYADV